MSPRFPRPTRITLVRARGQWRHTTVDAEGGWICGGLGGLPDDAAAEARLAGLGRAFFGGPLTVSWAPDGLDGTVTPTQPPPGPAAAPLSAGPGQP